MNAQFPITSTPKYSFPLSQGSLQLPQQLIELSTRSLKRPDLQVFPLGDTNDQPCIHESSNRLPSPARLVKLKSNASTTPIVAMDVSSIRLGDTKLGTLVAVRGAIVWKQTNGYRYMRLGPFPFHITKRSGGEIRRLLRQHRTSMPFVGGNSTLNIVPIQAKLATLLERWIQTFVNQAVHNSLILWDGSLMAGTVETPMKSMKQLLEDAHSRQNTILAFSKMTKLFSQGRRLTDLVMKHPPPCMLEIRCPVSHLGPLYFMGRVYVAKLSGGSCAFRLDVDKQLLHDHTVEAIQKLLGNDLIVQSYPETLRLAHIFSTFTATEVLGIQRCVTKENNIRILLRPNIRRLLFGRFGKGLEG